MQYVVWPTKAVGLAGVRLDSGLLEFFWSTFGTFCPVFPKTFLPKSPVSLGSRNLPLESRVWMARWFWNSAKCKLSDKLSISRLASFRKLFATANCFSRFTKSFCRGRFCASRYLLDQFQSKSCELIGWRSIKWPYQSKEDALLWFQLHRRLEREAPSYFPNLSAGR